MLEALLWFLQNLALAPYNLIVTLLNPSDWLAWSDREALARFIYYGASVELFFVVFVAFLIVTAVGMWRHAFLWGCVRGLEGFANAIGRTVAWAGLLLVLQQVMIVFLQRLFQVSEISLGPVGSVFSQNLSWWTEELKLYNALIVTMCVSYTFVQGGHVRVDLVYSAVSHRAKRVIDMFGCLVFMMPATVLIYLYGWFFMWRHLVVPNPSASTPLERMLMQAQVLRWNVETIGFSPQGFNAYFIFKVLIVVFCVLVLLQAAAFFWRSYLEYVEGEESAGKYLDRDILGDPAEDMQHEAHSGTT